MCMYVHMCVCVFACFNWVRSCLYFANEEIKAQMDSVIFSCLTTTQWQPLKLSLILLSSKGYDLNHCNACSLEISYKSVSLNVSFELLTWYSIRHHQISSFPVLIHTISKSLVSLRVNTPHFKNPTISASGRNFQPLPDQLQSLSEALTLLLSEVCYFPFKNLNKHNTNTTQHKHNTTQHNTLMLGLLTCHERKWVLAAALEMDSFQLWTPFIDSSIAMFEVGLLSTLLLPEISPLKGQLQISQTGRELVLTSVLWSTCRSGLNGATSAQSISEPLGKSNCHLCLGLTPPHRPDVWSF